MAMSKAPLTKLHFLVDLKVAVLCAQDLAHKTGRFRNMHRDPCELPSAGF
jgi:hypothetical protein